MKTEFYAKFFCTHALEIIPNAWWSLSALKKTTNPRHISQFTKLFLQKMFLEALECPLNSDLNPIENSYVIIESKVEKQMPENYNYPERIYGREMAKYSRNYYNQYFKVNKMIL